MSIELIVVAVTSPTAKENRQKQQGATEHRREGAAENIGLV